MFQENEATGDARISGIGGVAVRHRAGTRGGDDAALERGIRRLVLLYSVIFSFGGIPLLYMGDELALRNDTGYLADPERALDNRWMHRPPMDWAAAERRSSGVRSRAACSGGCSGWGRRAASLPALAAGGECHVMDVGKAALLVWRRRHPRSGTFVGVANFSPRRPHWSTPTR